MSTSLAALRQILPPAHESQTLAITWNTDMKVNLKEPPESASRSNCVWKDPKSKDFFLLGSGTKQPGLFHIKHQSSENIRSYQELYLEQIYLW